MMKKHGGRRVGSGRKRIHSPGVAHRTREKVSARTPLHISFRFKTTIRNKDTLRILKRATADQRPKARASDLALFYADQSRTSDGGSHQQ